MDRDIDEIKFEHLPTYLSNKFSKLKIKSTFRTEFGALNLNSILESTEKEYVLKCLNDSDGNVTKAAKRLGISRQNLHYRIRKHNL